MALLSQKQATIKLLPHAIESWQAYAESCVSDVKIACFTAIHADDILGCIIGKMQGNVAGLYPPYYGQVTDLLLDLHSPHKHQRTATRLLSALRDYFINHQLTQMRVHVPVHATLEQNFWRSQHVVHTDDTFWMTL